MARQKEEARSGKSWRPFPYPETPTSPVGCFASRTDWLEAECMPDLSHDARECFPAVDDDQLIFRISKLTELLKGSSLGILEPPATAKVCDPRLIFVPCVLADRFGARLGRGAGFYDRYLHLHPGVRAVGLVHSDYVLESFPPGWLHEGDHPLSALLTESSWYDFSSSSKAETTQ